MKPHHLFAIAALLSLCSALAEDHPQVELVMIPGATFVAGTPILEVSDKHYHAEEGRVTVMVPPFSIGKFPVTAAQFALFLNSVDTNLHPTETLYNHHDFIGVGSGKRLKYSTIEFADGKFQPRARAADAPANLVTWKGAVIYCQWLSEKSNEKYRLPSEAEWELAAGGPAKRPWPWGNAEPAPNPGERYDYSARKYDWSTNAVGSYAANTTPEGVRDMLGFRIGEWCAEKYFAEPKAQDLLDGNMDLTDLQTPRAVRGVWSKMDSRDTTPKILQAIGFWETPRHSHLGRPWTRSQAHPITEVTQKAAYGFRVVREEKAKVQETGQSGSKPTAKPGE